MVLELLINPRRAERKPWEMFVIGAVYSTVAIFLALWIFEEYVGLVMVFLTVLACTHMIQHTLKIEEKRDFVDKKTNFPFFEHWSALTYFMFMFLGFTAAFSLWYIFLPSDLSQQVFDVQVQTIRAINAPQAQGNFIDTSSVFGRIFINNLKVLLFTIIFAFFYGAGAVFILAWNASVVGVAIGSFTRIKLAQASAELGLSGFTSYFSSYSLGLLRYLTHGLPEILAYFVAALAGGIISIAVIRHDWNDRQFTRILVDSLDLIIISLAILFVAAVIEVWVTPLLFI